MAMFRRFSLLRRSGNQVFVGEPLQVVNPLRQTSDPAVPVFPPGGVTPPGSREVGHIRRAMVVLPTERNILARHPVKCPRHIPSFVWIAGILGEIGGARSGRGSVDRREKKPIPPWIVDLSASKCQPLFFSIEPHPAVGQVSQKNLLRTFL